MTEFPKHDESPYARRAYAYLERGYSVLPIAPGSKRPGAYGTTRESPTVKVWHGMNDWERYGERLPTDIELEYWYDWPDAGIGLVCGKLSGVIGLDRDYDCPGSDALEAIIPYSPVIKRGAKGYTKFFRYNGEPSKSWNIGGMRVLDMLSDGRQTVMPGTIHPDTGGTYVYLTEDCLEDFAPAELPMLPADFYQQVDRVIAPYQTDEDRKYQRRVSDDDRRITSGASVSAEYYRDLNTTALNNLELWVKRLIPGAVEHGAGFRCVATWRNCKNANVGIHPQGVYDFGGNYAMTAIDVVMHANGIPFQKAAEALRNCLPMGEDDVTMTFGGGSTSINNAPEPLYLPSATTVADTPAPALPAFLRQPPGILGRITAWINATAPKSQHEFAVAGSLALAATVMQRVYRSNRNNFTSLYFLLVGKSTEGKDYPLSAIPSILTQAGLPHLIAGSGYTSVGAVYSELLRKPSHLVTIDEFGKHLKMSRAKGNAAAEGALDKLIEVFGRLHGEVRPQAYSTMTLKNVDTADRVIYNPAISLLAASTPDTFYGNLTDDIVHDGLLGRFLVIESIQPRQLLNENDIAPIPRDVLEWCKSVHHGRRSGDLADVMNAEMPANPIPMQFDEACKTQLRQFEVEINDAKTAAESEQLDMLLGRSVEKAMRLSMIVAKASRPQENNIRPEDVAWAIQYVRHYDYALIDSVKNKRTRSDMDALIKKMCRYIDAARTYSQDKRFGKILEQGAMPRSKLLALMRIDNRLFTSAIDTAVESGVIGQGNVDGYAGTCYWHINQ